MSFAFRIDEDYIYPKETIAVHEAAKKHGIRLTWFINLEQGHKYPELIKFLAKHHEVQSHGWNHETYDDVKKSFKNIKKSKIFLENLGIKNDGYVPPFGFCSNADFQNLKDMKFSYVSDFAVGTKNFPHKLNGIINVPCHPMSLGVLMDLGYGKKNAIRYYERLIDQFCDAGLPVFLYGHSNNRLGKYPEVLEAIFKKVKEKKLKNVTLGECARSYKPRKEPIINVNIMPEDRRSMLTMLHRRTATAWFLLRELFRMHIWDWEKKRVRDYVR